MRGVDGERGGCAGWRERPARFDGERFAVDCHHFVFVLDIDVDGALAVGDGELGPAIQVDGSHGIATLGVDYGRVVWVAIHGKDALRRRIVDDAIRILVGLRLTESLERLQIEDDDFSLRAVGDESAAELGGNGDAVVLFQAGDVADDGAVVGVENFDLRAVGEIDAAGSRIDGDVVEVFAGTAFGRAETIFLKQVV